MNCLAASLSVVLLLALLHASDIAAQTSTGSDVVVKNLKLFVDGAEFIVKGMAYQPSPISFLNATGLCSPHISPYPGTPMLSSCFDSDLFDGGTYPMASQPSNGWFYALWVRDLPEIASIGVNTLRIYNANPTTRQASENYQGQYNIAAPYGKDHVPFFDYAQSQGLKIMWPLYSNDQALLNDSIDELQFFIARQIDEVGYHPALLMYILGNELNYIGNESVWFNVLQRINSLAAYARDYQQSKWNRTVPITTGTDDNGPLYDSLMQALPNLDFLTANAGYRGVNFTNLWSGWGPGSEFTGWYNLSCFYQKPLLIGEMNPVGYSDPAPGTYLPTGFNEQWWDLLNHVSQGAIGGFFFEWSDELWKASGNQSGLGLVTPSVNCDGASDCSTDLDVWLADTIADKGWQYQSVCCGNYSGVAYNFQSDPFQLLGRKPEQLGSATAENCSAFNYSSLITPTLVVSGAPTSALERSAAPSPLQTVSAIGIAVCTLIVCALLLM